MSGFRHLAILMLILNFGSISNFAHAEVEPTGAASATETSAGATGSGIADSISGLFQTMTCTKDLKPPAAPTDTVGKLIATPTTTCLPKSFATIQKMNAEYTKDFAACPTKFTSAQTWCLENCSPDIKNVIGAANGLIAGMSQTSLSDACDRTGKIMNLVQMGLTAFTGNCAAQKLMCDNSCGSATRNLAKMAAALEPMHPIPMDCQLTEAPADAAAFMKAYATWEQYKASLAAAIKKESAPEGETVAAKAKTCTGYAANIASALAGAASSLMSAKQAANCNKQTNNTPVAQDTTCNNPALANTQKCICEKAPRTPGCTLANGTTGTNSDFGSPSSSTTTSGTGGANLVGGSGLSGDIAGLRKGEAGSVDGGGAGAPTGGGGGGLDGGGGGGSGGGNGQQQIVRKFGTNIYGGEGGGGGGAFGRMGGGSGGSQGAADTRSPAAIQAHEAQMLRQQISSDGGRSNWEKIKTQYGQQKPSLLGI